ncbi:hypothetical protein SNEBB_010454 [Seison nebaliae]|nr:hypothetical protein SNEBB_010454 [Seison nebaliae]
MTKPLLKYVLLYSFTAVTLINACGAFGWLLTPCMTFGIYPWIILTLIGLSVATLSSTAVLHLLPLGLVEGTNLTISNFSLLFICFGVYAFLILDEIICAMRSRKKDDEKTMTEQNNQNENLLAETDHEMNIIRREKNDDHGHSHSTPGSSSYLIIIGDSVHNFVDGLAIGTSFNSSLKTGLFVSIAVFFEELPHELGDFAILLSSGMQPCQAVRWNLFSGLSCYVGMLIGSLVGHKWNMINKYVLLFAAGMFFYIALGTVLPELRKQKEKLYNNFRANKDNDQKSGRTVRLWITLCEHTGILLGFAISVISAYTSQ